MKILHSEKKRSVCSFIVESVHSCFDDIPISVIRQLTISKGFEGPCTMKSWSLVSNLQKFVISPNYISARLEETVGKCLAFRVSEFFEVTIPMAVLMLWAKASKYAGFLNLAALNLVKMWKLLNTFQNFTQ